MRQTFKKMLQPLEIALKKTLGIRKVKKGQIFDLRGFAQDSREKITRFVLFLPLFQKIRTLVGVSEFSNSGNVYIVRGGGDYKINPRFAQ